MIISERAGLLTEAEEVTARVRGKGKLCRHLSAWEGGTQHEPHFRSHSSSSSSCPTISISSSSSLLPQKAAFSVSRPRAEFESRLPLPAPFHRSRRRAPSKALSRQPHEQQRRPPLRPHPATAPAYTPTRRLRLIVFRSPAAVVALPVRSHAASTIPSRVLLLVFLPPTPAQPLHR